MPEVSALIYTRVSSDPHGLGKSVADQERECRALAEGEGWRVIEALTDNDIGASAYSRGRRSAWEQTLRLLPTVDVLITWESSRATRDLTAYAQLRQLCIDHGVTWAYSGKVVDFSRAEDRLASGIDALLAERESALISERSLRGLRARLESRAPHGRIAYGYTRTRDPRTGKTLEQMPDPDTAPIVREVARRALAGETSYSIAADLQRRGVSGLAGGRWSAVQVRRLATRPAYAGLLVHRGKVVGPGDWPALISEDEHHQLVAIFSQPGRRVASDTRVRHLLVGIARCGGCGGGVRVGVRGIRRYQCKENWCTSRNQAWLDEFVTETVIARLTHPGFSEVFSPPETEDTPLREAVSELEILRERLHEAYEEAAAGSITMQALGSIETTLQGKLDAAEETVRRLTTPDVDSDTARDLRVLGQHDEDTVRERWQALPLDRQRAVIRALVEIELLPAGKAVKGKDPRSIRFSWR